MKAIFLWFLFWLLDVIIEIGEYMKKKLLVGGIVVVFIVIAVIAYFVFDNVKKENELIEEINKIVALSEKEDIDMFEINKLLDRTVTSGDYQKIEVAAKNYMRDSLDNIMVMYDILSEDDLINILSISNIREDGPLFNETRKYITETKDTLINARDEYYEYFTEEVIMSYLDTNDLDDYYIDLYKNDVIGDYESERNDTTIKDSINDIINLLEIEVKVLDFLTNNKDYWVIEGENIVFDTDVLLEEYNTLIGELSSI